MGISKQTLMSAATNLGWKAVCPDCHKPGCMCGKEECECPVCDCKDGRACTCKRPGICECASWVQFEGSALVQINGLNYRRVKVVLVAEISRGWVKEILAAPATAQVAGIDSTEINVYNKAKGTASVWSVEQVTQYLPTPAKAAKNLGLHRVGT